MKRLVLCTGQNQGWILINVTSSDEEHIVRSGEIVNFYGNKRDKKFKINVDKLGLLLSESRPDEIILECSDDEPNEDLIMLIQFYVKLTDCRIFYFPTSLYFIYMGVKYDKLSLEQLISVGKNLFPSLLRELAYTSSYSVRPVLMNYCFNKYERTS